MIARRTVLTLANMFVGSVLGLVAIKLASLYFGPFYIGQVTYAAAGLGLLSFMMDLGMGAAHVKRVSEGRDAGDCFATYAVFKLVVTALYVVVTLGLLAVYVLVLHNPLESTTLPIVLITLGYFVARSFSDLVTSSFDAKLETAKTQLTQFAETLVRVGITALGALILGGTILAQNAGALAAWVHLHPGETYAIATTAGGLAAMLVAGVLMWRAFEVGRFRMALLKDYARFALPLFLIGAVGMLAIHIDSAMLGYFGSERDVGVFAQVRRLPYMLAGFSSAINVLLFPTISAMIARGDAAGAQVTANRAMRYLSMLLVPMCAFVIAFAGPIIRLGLSDEFLPGSLALRLLAVYVVIQALGNVHALMLLGANRERTAAKVAVLSSAVLVALALLLVPNDIRSVGLRLAGLGVTGAAIAALLAGLVWYAGLRLATGRHLGFRESTGIWKHIAASAIMIAALVALGEFVTPLARWYHFAVYVPLGAAIYAGALIALRELTRDDAAFVRDALHPGEMLHYVRSEVFHRRK